MLQQYLKSTRVLMNELGYVVDIVVDHHPTAGIRERVPMLGNFLPGERRQFILSAYGAVRTHLSHAVITGCSRCHRSDIRKEKKSPQCVYLSATKRFYSTHPSQDQIVTDLKIIRFFCDKCSSPDVHMDNKSGSASGQLILHL
eukprot:scpid97820/ scgid29509/ 